MSWKETGWNGLAFQCPRNWDTIVSGDNHLLFEDNFQPVLEMRWNRGKEDTTNTEKTILRNLKKDNALFPAKSIPASWQSITDRYSVHLLLKATDEAPSAALLCCRNCGVTILITFFETLPAAHPNIATLFSTLCCHDSADNKTLWAIQDFRLVLSDSYQLTSYNFGAGLTRLTFNKRSLILHICRLAPASQRLQKMDLAELLMVLGDIVVAKETITQTKNMVSHASHPPIYKQILLRMKRKLPFHEMRLRHHPECDRLTGIFLFDKKPIPRESVSPILTHYEIFET